MITTLTLILIAAVAYSLVCGFVGRVLGWLVMRAVHRRLLNDTRGAGPLAPYKGPNGTHIS